MLFLFFNSTNLHMFAKRALAYDIPHTFASGSFPISIYLSDSVPIRISEFISRPFSS